MCRLLGIVGKRAVPVSECLTTAKRSLSVLSREHPDGWGVALHSRTSAGWRVHRSTERAHACGEFRRVAEEGAAEVVIAHVRQKTVGHTSIDNTHPFTRGRWVFAHNGTVRRIDVLEGRSSRRRLREIQGDTDTERLFAFFLSRLDEAGLADEPASAATDRVVAEATRELRGCEELGAWNYLLSDGKVLYAHRFGRSMCVLARRDAVLVASEPITDEPWAEVPEGALLRVEQSDSPHVVHLPRTP
jgi:predicted glutamine amidotransferase